MEIYRQSHHLENVFWTFSPERNGQLIWNLIGTIGVTCRSKIAKSHTKRKSKMVALVAMSKIYFEPKGQLTQNFIGSMEVDQKSLESFDWKSKMATMAAILKICIELLLNQKASWLKTCLVIRWGIQGHLGPFVYIVADDSLNFLLLFFREIRLGISCESLWFTWNVKASFRWKYKKKKKKKKIKLSSAVIRPSSTRKLTLAMLNKLRCHAHF